VIALAAQEQQTLYVGFDGLDVAVASDEPDVLAGLRNTFSSMLAPQAPRVVGRIDVWRRGGRYHAAGHVGGDLEEASLADVLRVVRFSVIQLLIQARPDLLWLHAGAAASDARAILLPGGRGRGKSTLVASLCARGWTYVSDDIVPVHPGSRQAMPFPLTPARRLFPGREMPEAWLRESHKVAVSVLPGRTCREPVPVGAVVFPCYGVGARAELTPCPPAQTTLELLRQCWNFAHHREAAVRCLCRWSGQVPAYRLTFSDGDRAADLLVRSCRMAQPTC
jgi:hypothetical protein